MQSKKSNMAKSSRSGSAASAPAAETIAADDSGDKAAELSLLLGQKVRHARAAKGMTMKQLAVQADISLPYLSRVEKGDGNISIAVLYRLAKALNLPIENLVSDSERYGADYTLIVELLKRQSPETLAELRTWLARTVGPRSERKQPLRVALIGLRGAGKSTIGALLARKHKVPFVELNREIEAEAGVSLGEIFNMYGQAGYRRLERRCLERVIARYPEVVMATGGGIVTEAASYELLLHSFYNVWMYAAPEVSFERVMKQHDARIASPQLREEAMESIRQTMQARDDLYKLAHARIDSSGKTVAQTVDELVSLLSRRKDN